MKQFIKKTYLSIGLIVTIFAGSAGVAVATPQTTYAASCGGANILGIPPWYEGLCDGGNKIMSPAALPQKIPNDRTGIATFASVVALNIVTILMFVVGYVSLAFIIWGGFKYIISGDNANGVSAAKKTIINAVIGLVLSIMSVGIVNLIANSIV